MTTQLLPQEAILFVPTPATFLVPLLPAAIKPQAATARHAAHKGVPAGHSALCGTDQDAPSSEQLGKKKEGSSWPSPATTPSRGHPVRTCAPVFWGHLRRPLRPLLGHPQRPGLLQRLVLRGF